MFLDNSLAFSSTWSTAQAITTTANGTNLIDITGAGSGTAPAMIGSFPAVNTAMGADYGAGDGLTVPYLYLTVTAVGSSANTLTISIAAAPDNGSYSAGTYTTLYTSNAFVESTLDVGDILLVPLPPMLGTDNDAPEALPRFYRITYTCSAAVTVSVLAGLVLNPVINEGRRYSNNFLAV